MHADACSYNSYYLAGNFKSSLARRYDIDGGKLKQFTREYTDNLN